jgi:hypothetical protein
MQGYVVLTIVGTMTSSDFSYDIRSNFVFSLYQALHRYSSDPMRSPLSHDVLPLHSDPLTPVGSSGLHIQRLRPFRGLRQVMNGSTPTFPLAGLA